MQIHDDEPTLNSVQIVGNAIEEESGPVVQSHFNEVIAGFLHEVDPHRVQVEAHGAQIVVLHSYGALVLGEA